MIQLSQFFCSHVLTKTKFQLHGLGGCGEVPYPHHPNDAPRCATPKSTKKNGGNNMINMLNHKVHPKKSHQFIEFIVHIFSPICVPEPWRSRPPSPSRSAWPSHNTSTHIQTKSKNKKQKTKNYLSRVKKQPFGYVIAHHRTFEKARSLLQHQIFFRKNCSPKIRNRLQLRFPTFVKTTIALPRIYNFHTI